MSRHRPLNALPFLVAATLLALLSGCGEATDDADPAPDPLTRSAPVVSVPADLPLDAPAPETPPDSPGALQRALAETRGPVILELEAGQHLVQPSDFIDLACGNCQDPEESVPGTVGLLIGGRDVAIVGPGADETVIRTYAGYGLFFEGCHGCRLEGVTVTGGIRDPDDRATNAGVVARDATLRLEGCRIADNIGDSATVVDVVVGIAGIAGREGSRLEVEGCRIERNSWDGIALYRGARAEIRDNLIDGVDAASGATIGGGRGTGIGLTWNARAVVEGNRVRRYWKGIGAFVDAEAEVRHNVVEEILTWGLSEWAAGDGRARADFEGNVVFRTGACGAMLMPSATSESPGRFVGNALIETAGNEAYDSGEPYCEQRPIARGELPDGYVIEGNLLHGNRFPGVTDPPEELDEGDMREALQPIFAALAPFEAPAASTFRSVWQGGR